MASSQLRNLLQKNRNAVAAVAAAGVAVTPGVAMTTFMSADSVHAPTYPWRHTGLFSGFDCAAVRRGFQVYREVCATCHSVNLIRWRELVGVTHTKEEVTEMAKEVEVMDGPNDEGEMFERPAKLFDKLPMPYANKEAGRAANGGAYPPDLSLMVKARHSGHDYIFALLTGYVNKPAGKEMMDTLYYNPYFPGGAISMPPPLQDGGVEYEDGTVATVSQQARDVAQFLAWTAEPEMEERKKSAGKYLSVLAFMCVATGLWKRWKWSPLKTRMISYVKET